MNVTDHDNMTDEYNDSLSKNNSFTNNENDFDLFLPTLLLTIPCGLSFLCLVTLLVNTIIKLLFHNKQMEKFPYPTNPVRCIITGPSESGKSVILTNLILKVYIEYGKI